MFFISENGAVIYKGINFIIIEVLISIFFKSCKLFKFESKINNLIICGVKVHIF